MQPDDATRVAAEIVQRHGLPDPASAEPAITLPVLPDEFWTARDVHKVIRDAAHAHLAPADALLHAILAKTSAMASPSLRFDSGIGTPASLNYNGAIVGPSGTGKTLAGQVARRLIAVPGYLDCTAEGSTDGAPAFLDGIGLGSGEGIAEAFYGIGTDPSDPNDEKPRRRQIRENVFIMVDEGEVFTRLTERTGTTLATTVRSAWVGALIGQANGNADRTRLVQAGRYSLGMLIGFQLAAALPLLTDTMTGTAQRFAWASAIDPSIPDEPSRSVDVIDTVKLALTWQETGRGARTGDIEFPATLRATLRAQHLAKARGEIIVPERNSHEPLMRCKMAALLALLDGRDKVDDEDWELSAVLWHTSCAVRDAVEDYGRRLRERDSEERSRARVDMTERQAIAAEQAPAKVRRIADTISKHVLSENGMTRGAMNRALPGRDRHLLDQAIENAVQRGLIRSLEGTSAYMPGETNGDGQ